MSAPAIHRPTLAEIVSESIACRESLFDPDSLEFTLSVSRLAVLDAELSEKVDGYRQILQSCQSDIDAMDVEINRLKDRRDAARNGMDRLKSHLASCAIAAGYEKVSHPLFNLTIKPKGKVVCTVTARELPDDLVRISETRTADLTAIREAMEAGREVPAEFRPTLLWR